MYIWKVNFWNKIEPFKIGYSTNILNKEDKEYLAKIFEENDISNSELFFKLLNEFNENDDEWCGILSWNNTKNFRYNEALCWNRYEKTHDIMDWNCRITAFTMMQDNISIDKTDEQPSTNLIFDADVLENNKNYKKILDDKERFFTFYNNMDVSWVSLENLDEIFPKRWKEYWIKNNSKISIISVVMYDEDFNELFVGHAWILIKLEDKMIFIEKIAFEQPYQINVIKTEKDLIELFADRDTYFGDENEKWPFIYIDDRLLYSYN